MSLQDDAWDVAAYIKQCQESGSQPDMDYVAVFDRICDHLWHFEEVAAKLKIERDQLKGAAKILAGYLED